MISMVAMSEEEQAAQITPQGVARDGRDVDPITDTRYEKLIYQAVHRLCHFAVQE